MRARVQKWLVVLAAVVGLLYIASVATYGIFAIVLNRDEHWVTAQNEFLAEIPPVVVDHFGDDYSARATTYAISVDCFRDIKPQSEVDLAIKTACLATVPRTGLGFSQLVDMRAFCDDANYVPCRLIE